MASDKDMSKIERLRERLLLCTICMDEYKDPRILPCHHSVCMECLVEYVRLSTATGRFFRCPQCRADIMVPGGGLKDFPPNFFVSSLMDEIGSKPYSNSCEICERMWLAAQFRCIDCDKDICRFCIPEHKLFTHDSLQMPRIIRIETAPVSELQTATRSCLKHGEPPNVFCEECNETLCLSCVCEFHKSHKTVSLAQRLQQVEKQLSAEKLNVVCELENIETDLEKLDSFAEQVCQGYAGIKNQINYQAEQLHNAIEERCTKQVKKVDDAEENFLNQVKNYRQRYEKYQKQVSNANNFLSEVQHEDLTLELMTQYMKYKSQLKSAKKQISKKIQFSQLQFIKGMWILFLGFLVVTFGSTRKHFFKSSYKFSPNFSEVNKSQSKSKILSVFQAMRKYIPTIRYPKWLSSALGMCYVGMVTILMTITLIYLAYQYLTLETKVCYKSDVLFGFLFCLFLFIVFGATVKNVYWDKLKAAWARKTRHRKKQESEKPD